MISPFDDLTALVALPTWVTVLIWTIDIIIRLALLGIVPGNRRPAVAMAWLLVIFIMPLPGLLLFLLLGTFRLGGQRRARQDAVTDELTRATRHLELPHQLGEAPEYVEASANLTRALTGFPMLDGNRFEMVTDYRECLARMAEDIDQATDYVHVMFYIMAVDPEGRKGYADVVIEAMERAQQRGVKVRLLFDHIASLRVKGYRKMLRRLRGGGIEFHLAMPFQPWRGKYQRPDLRNHRKMLIVDGEVAYTGSLNLIEPGYKRPSSWNMGREWVDVMARVTGPTVASLDLVFATDWYSETGEHLDEVLRGVTDEEFYDHEGAIAQVIPSGPGFATENNLRAFNHLFYNAEQSLTVVSPYLVPDDSMLYALTGAAQRGIDVELIVCRKADQFMVHHAQQSYYRQLLRAGIRIFRYPDPDVLHSKLFTIDDEVAMIGSSNMDMRSFSLNMEVSVLVADEDVVRDVNEIIRSYRDQCEELTLEEWLERPRHKRWLDNVFRLTSALQ